MQVQKFLANLDKQTLTPEEVAKLDPLQRWYYRLWSKYGGRYWTYIARDFVHRYVWVFLLICLGVGVLLGHFLPFWLASLIIGVLAIGIVLGHLFFTRYIPNQGTDTEGQWNDPEDMK